MQRECTHFRNPFASQIFITRAENIHTLVEYIVVLLGYSAMNNCTTSCRLAVVTALECVRRAHAIVATQSDVCSYPGDWSSQCRSTSLSRV
jgi:hypothetical protein